MGRSPEKTRSGKTHGNIPAKRCGSHFNKRNAKNDIDTCDSIPTKEWARKVYSGSKHDSFYESQEWGELRSKCIRRDGFHCQRCDKGYRTWKHLEAHHIKPRDEGGPDDLSNLITLCQECHDFVEGNDLTTKAAIIGSMQELPSEEEKVIAEAPVAEEGKPDWRAWVYGGQKRPQRQWQRET